MKQSKKRWEDVDLLERLSQEKQWDCKRDEKKWASDGLETLELHW